MDDSGEQTDAQLLRRSRDGDRHAFSELWRRHAPIAVAYARSLGAAPPDPEDVVSDAFLNILHLLRAGKGPEDRFRPYLLTTVRNTWVSAARRAPATLSIDDAEHPVSTLGAIDVDAMVNSTTIAEAFSSLPERWQHALWLSEVEQLPPRAIADVLQLRPNSVAALTYRARDALRKAWIRAHLRHAPEGTEHARVIELLGAYAHDDLSPRSQRVVTSHLDDCADCRAAAGEARHLARAMTLGPLLAGGTGLVVAPLLFPADQVAATTLTAAPGVTGWLGAHAPALQPAVDAAGHANPLLWPVAAAAAVALSVSGSLFVRPVPEPDAVATHSPTLVMPSPAAPAEEQEPEQVSEPVIGPSTPVVVSPAPQPPGKAPKSAITLPDAVPPFVEKILGAVKPPRSDEHLAEEQDDERLTGKREDDQGDDWSAHDDWSAYDDEDGDDLMGISSFSAFTARSAEVGDQVGDEALLALTATDAWGGDCPGAADALNVVAESVEQVAEVEPSPRSGPREDAGPSWLGEEHPGATPWPDDVLPAAFDGITMLGHGEEPKSPKR